LVGGLASGAGRWEGFGCEPLRRKSRSKGVVAAQKKVDGHERVRTV